jgi:Ca-activated chloride channel family protein
MSFGFSYALTHFDAPAWLAALPIALTPIVREWLRPVRFAAAIGGWESSRQRFGTAPFRSRWITTLLIALGAACLIIANAGPRHPEFAWFEPSPNGHHWSVVLDCSGSMGQVDPGRDRSRLDRLAEELIEAFESRPHDRFAIVRVAGYADRVGPTVASRRYLADQLRSIKPAQPGEDGTSLADGLVLAVEALPTGIENSDASILIVSDGRDNPPDANAFRLDEIVPRALRSGVRVDWLRVALPKVTDETPESLSRAIVARRSLEKLVSESGGTIIDIDASADRSAIGATMLGRLASGDKPKRDLNSAAIAAALACLTCWAVAGGMTVVVSRKRSRGSVSAFVASALMLVASAATASVVCLVLTRNRTDSLDSAKAISRWAIVLDTSPSMEAQDSAEGTRLATAKILARGLISRLALEKGAKASLVAFSGRAVPMAPWTDDWRALDSIVADAGTNSLRPTGSDWNAALAALPYDNSSESTTKTRVATTVLILSDGEAGRQPTDAAIERLEQAGWKVILATFGSAEQPGAIFRKGDRSDGLWIDRRTGKPARSRRDDSIAERIAERTGGKVIPIGPDSFDAASLAADLVGPLDANPIAPRIEDRTSLNLLLILAFCLFATAEAIGLVKSSFRRRVPPTLIAIVSLSFASCRFESDPAAAVREITDTAWEMLRRGDSFRARAILRLAGASHPDEPALPYDLALLELSSGSSAEATAALDQAAERANRMRSADPPTAALFGARVTAARGYAYALERRWDDARKAFEQTIASGSLTPREIADVQANLAFVRRKLDGPKQDRPESGRNSEDSSLSERTNLARDAEPDPLSPTPNEWNRLADAVRGRAGTARKAFEPAGDELKAPGAALPDAGAIDW